MKNMIKHIASFLGLAFFIAIAAASFSKAIEPCEYRTPYIDSKTVSVTVYDKLDVGTPVPGATVKVVVRDFNPEFDPDYAECDFTTAVTLQSTYYRTTNDYGYIEDIETGVFEHDNNKDYTEVTIYVTADYYWPFRETQVLYYDNGRANFDVKLIDQRHQP